MRWALAIVFFPPAKLGTNSANVHRRVRSGIDGDGNRIRHGYYLLVHESFHSLSILLTRRVLAMLLHK